MTKIILLLIPIIAITLFISYANGQNTTNSNATIAGTGLTENLTNVDPPSDLIIQADIISDLEVPSVTGSQIYKIQDPRGILINFHPDVSISDFQLFSYLSSPNRVNLSEDSIEVSFAFKLPISNITSQIERINNTFTVDYITNTTDYVEYQGGADNPLVLNGTTYQQPTIFLTMLKNGTSFITIQNFLDQ